MTTDNDALVQQLINRGETSVEEERKEYLFTHLGRAERLISQRFYEASKGLIDPGALADHISAFGTTSDTSPAPRALESGSSTEVAVTQEEARAGLVTFLRGSGLNNGQQNAIRRMLLDPSDPEFLDFATNGDPIQPASVQKQIRDLSSENDALSDKKDELEEANGTLSTENGDLKKRVEQLEKADGIADFEKIATEVGKANKVLADQKPNALGKYALSHAEISGVKSSLNSALQTIQPHLPPAPAAPAA